MLHITNGSSVSLQVPGEIIYWVDVLHEGPVPAGLTLEELSSIREQFLSQYLGEPVSFAARNSALTRFRDHEEVVLWFEHDLYDQLHLIQLLDWFARQNLAATRLSLISIDRYLGTLQPEELNDLFPARREVSSAEFQTAQQAWQAFTSPDPTRLLTAGGPALPFLKSALLRHLEQFPGVHDGLSRTERQALQLTAQSPLTSEQLFLADQALEPAIFMGDTVYYQYLRALQEANRPLLAAGSVTYAPTPFGHRVLSGQADHVRTNGLDTWRGGVHLHAGSPIFRWDPKRGTIAP